MFFFFYTRDFHYLLVNHVFPVPGTGYLVYWYGIDSIALPGYLVLVPGTVVVATSIQEYAVKL